MTHWYFTPDKVAELRQNPPVKPTAKNRGVVSRVFGWVSWKGVFRLGAVALCTGGGLVMHPIAAVIMCLFACALVVGDMDDDARHRRTDKAEIESRQRAAEWETVVKPLIDGGVNPANLSLWMELPVEIRENAVRLQIPLQEAEFINIYLHDRVVTPMVFVEAVDRMEADREAFMREALAIVRAQNDDLREWRDELERVGGRYDDDWDD